MSGDSESALEWTGERYLPEVAGQIALEHVHRYLCARAYCRGKAVLDVASGEGYGSALLAASAERVIGVDLAAEAVAHAQARYRRPNLEFRQGSCIAIPLPDASFDVVVSFETIEHIDQHEAMLAEIKRVLKPDGLLIISSPEKREYSDIPNYKNAFHVKELYRNEFEALMAKYFANHVTLGQRVLYGSVIAAEAPESSFVSYHMEENATSGQQGLHRPLYLLALASDAPLPAATGGLMETALDRSELAQSLQHQTRILSQEIDTARIEIERLNDDRMRLHGDIARLGKEREQLIADRMQLAFSLAQSEADRKAAKTRLKQLRKSLSWRITKPLRRIETAVTGEQRDAKGDFSDSKPRTDLADRIRAALAQGAGAPAIKTKPGAPHFSVVIAASDGVEHLLRCLAGIARNPSYRPFEVIVADDGTNSAIQSQLSGRSDVRLVRTNGQTGFAACCNRGATEARGEYLVFLSSAAIVLPKALDALLQTFEKFPDTGMVGSKAIDPDGRLCEAGRIAWADGSSTPYGLGGDPGLPEFNYLRAADGFSATSTMARRSLFHEIGGFDTRLASGDDACMDLAMAIRSRGQRVLYQPHSEVIQLRPAEAPTPATNSASRGALLHKWGKDLAWLGDEAGANLQAAANRGAVRRILILAPRMPTPDQDSGSVDLTNAMRVLLSLGFRVTFCSEANPGRLPGYTELLEGMGVECPCHPYFKTIAGYLIASGAHFDAFMLVRAGIAASYIDIIRGLFPVAKIVFNTTDLHYLRAERRLAIDSSPGLAETALELKRQELDAIRKADATLVVSSREKEILADDAPGANVHWIPAIYDNAPLSQTVEKGRDAITFIGGFGHHPNIDAARWFCREIWPIIESKLPKTEFLIVGSNPTAEVLALAGNRVKVLGFIKDLRPVLERTRMTVAPLRYGAGQKGKIVRSLAEGIPCVTTTIGAEGMALIEGETILTADAPEAFASQVQRLYQDDGMWQRLSKAGLDHVRAQHGFEHCRELYRQMMSGILPEAATMSPGQ